MFVLFKLWKSGTRAVFPEHNLRLTRNMRYLHVLDEQVKTLTQFLNCRKCFFNRIGYVFQVVNYFLVVLSGVVQFKRIIFLYLQTSLETVNN